MMVHLPKRDKKYGIGKRMGNCVYVHWTAIDVLPKEIQLRIMCVVIPFEVPFDWTVIKYDESNGNISLIESLDWDIADEPTVGQILILKNDGSRKLIKPSKDPWIYHHKWLFVADDYRGFNVKKSVERSLQWMSIQGIDYNRIGKKSYWENNVLTLIKGD